jgi:rhodanese-related sulfurtransferase
MTETDLIDTREVKEKLDRGEDFKLVMTLGEWEYRTSHIPGSMRISTVDEALEALHPHEEIILYDSGPPCMASRTACRLLQARGYTRVRRYVGGLQEWESAGHELEGEEIE